jgi:hypothetical protein
VDDDGIIGLIFGLLVVTIIFMAFLAACAAVLFAGAAYGGGIGIANYVRSFRSNVPLRKALP